MRTNAPNMETNNGRRGGWFGKTSVQNIGCWQNKVVLSCRPTIQESLAAWPPYTLRFVVDYLTNNQKTTTPRTPAQVSVFRNKNKTYKTTTAETKNENDKKKTKNNSNNNNDAIAPTILSSIRITEHGKNGRTDRRTNAVDDDDAAARSRVCHSGKEGIKTD